jgi:hypothetical protein
MKPSHVTGAEFCFLSLFLKESLRYGEPFYYSGFTLKCNSGENLTQGPCFGMKKNKPPDTFFIENRVFEFAWRKVWRPCYWLGALSFASKSAFLNH